MDKSLLRYRNFKLKDADDLAQIADNPEIAKYLRDNFPNPYSVKDAKNFIRGQAKDSSTLVKAILYDELLIGAIGFHRNTDVYRRSAEVGYWLAQDYWGMGIMSFVVDEWTRRAFDILDVDRIYGIVFEGNSASEKILEKAGYQKEGIQRKSIYKEGKILDSSLWSFIIDDIK